MAEEEWQVVQWPTWWMRRHPHLKDGRELIPAILKDDRQYGLEVIRWRAFVQKPPREIRSSTIKTPKKKKMRGRIYA